MPALSFFQEVDSVIYGEDFPSYGYWWWQRRGRNQKRALEFHDKKTMPKTKAEASETVGFFPPFEKLHRRHKPLNNERLFDPKIAKLRHLPVALKDLKKGAYKHVTHVKGTAPKHFDAMFSSNMFDVLLYRLIQYMEAEERLKEFVDEKTREAMRQRALKAQGILNAPPAIGAFDQIKHDDKEQKLKEKIKTISSQLGEIYGGFLLGLRQEPDFHHMKQGRTFFSNKRVEMNLFEFLYVFLTQFIWLLYDCKDSKLKLIRKKVTEVFRTELFNYGGRKIHSDTTYGDVKEGVVERHPKDEWVSPQRELDEEWVTRPRKKLLPMTSTAVTNYAEKLELQTKDGIRRLDIFGQHAPPSNTEIGIKRVKPSVELLRCLETEIFDVGILGENLFRFDPETMKRLKKRTKSPERFLFKYLERDMRPQREESQLEPMATTREHYGHSGGTSKEESALAEEEEEDGAGRREGEDEEAPTPATPRHARFADGDKVVEEDSKLKMRSKPFLRPSSYTMSSLQSSTTEKDFIGNEELSRKNIQMLERKIDLYHSSIKEIRAQLVPGAVIETTLTKNGFTLPIFKDEVVTKEVESDEDGEDEIAPPKGAAVIGDPVKVDMTDGRQFALWRRKSYVAPRRCSKTGKIM